MTVWCKLENEEVYAVAIYNFLAKPGHLHLSLDVGELVHIERETGDWYWGRSLRRDATGAFPKSYVLVRDCIVDRCGETVVASAGGTGVVHDIAVTLREWLEHWKKLYITNDERLKFMEVSMRALLELRGEAASGALPQDQLRRVARTAVFTIDKGNRTLGMELAVRTANGQLVDPFNVSTYRLNALHDEANTRIDKNMETTPIAPPPAQPAGARTYTIAVRVHNFVCRINDPAELALALYDASGTKLTEHLYLRWPINHVSPVLVVFTDFGSDILKSEKIYLVANIVRLGLMDAQNVDHRRSSVAQPAPVMSSSRQMRRPFGVACVDIKQNITRDNSDKHFQVPFYPYEKENLDALLKKVIANRDIKDAKQQGLWVSVQLVEGDLKQIREENPHIVVGNTAVARKMGFPEVILPGDARNDLYLTLCCGSFSKGGGKSSERNIELVARVVDKNGQIIRGVVSIGEGMPLADEYTSVVYYHDDRPRWQEVFKVCLNIEAFKEAHLVFLCRHRSSNEAKDRAEKHFALSYLRLMQREGTTTPDTQHNLCVYKIDIKRSNSQQNDKQKQQLPTDVEAEACAACLGVPSKRSELPAGAENGLTRGVLSLVHRDTLTVATKLCSTKLTQREEILGVLKWSTHHAEGTLRRALKQLMNVPSEELVKFLQDILDALFSILTQVQEKTVDQDGNVVYSEESYGVLVLDCLLRVISLVADHKYQHFQPVLHVYIDESFCDAIAYEKLISVMVWVIRAANAGDAALKRLLLCMKCIESLIRLIVRSRQLRSALGDRASDHDFFCLFQSLLDSLVWLMRCGKHALTCQGTALKFLSNAVPHIIKVYPDTELSAYIVRALDALSFDRLGKQRMMALLDLVKGPLCAEPGARALLLPHLAETTKELLKDKAEWDREAAHKSRSAGKAAKVLGAHTAKLQEDDHHQQFVELCVETLGEVMSLLARDDVGPVEADRAELARRLLPTVLKTAASMLKDRKSYRDSNSADNALLRRVISVLLDMVRQMSEHQYTMVVRALEAENRDHAGSLVSDALSLFLAILQRPVFRPHWADMLHLQHHVMLHALRLLSTTLRERLHSTEETDTEALTVIHAMCRTWFEAGSSLATSESLQLETLPAARKQRLTALYGDIRRGVADCLSDMWYCLGEHKRSFIPCLVGPFLEVSFLRDEDVRNTTIPLFFDMMQTEYSHSVAHGEVGDSPLRELESEMIDKVDVLVERGYGDVAWRARFVSLCGALCTAAGGGLKVAAAALVAAAARQLDALLQYRAVDNMCIPGESPSYHASSMKGKRLDAFWQNRAALRSGALHRMHITTCVLHFYQQIERPHMYIRYVHKLAKMHLAAEQWAEAGLSLRLHAKLLAWSNDPLPPRLRHPTIDYDTHTTTHRDLKEYLYLEIAKLLKRGHQWELAVEIVKELVSVYEEEALGYAPLADLHSQLASLYEAMMRTQRSHPGYFRVIYHGKGFPELLTKATHGYVYRGNEYEQLHDFKDRLLDEWPDAEVLPKLDPPGPEITESDGQYLQINAVEPVMGDKLKRLSGKPIAEQILQYYKHNNVDKFQFSRPFHRYEESIGDSTDDLVNQNEFATRWLERTELLLSEKLPGILRWFEVRSQRTYEVSPVAAAVEALRDTNRKLRSLIVDTKSPDSPLHPLTMRLSGILDAQVQGGIVNYERAFLTPAYEARHPEHAPLLAELKDLIADQIPLLKHGLDIHAERCPTELAELHAHLDKCFRRVQQHVHQRYGRKNCDLEVDSPEVQLRMPFRDSLSHESESVADNRISDISAGTDISSKPGRFFSFNSVSAINPLSIRNSSSSVVNRFATLQNSPGRRNKRQLRKSEVGSQPSGSQWYTTHSTPNGSTTNTPISSPTNSSSVEVNDPPSALTIRELRQEVSKAVYNKMNNSRQFIFKLVSERPLRSDAERERRLSQRTSLLNNSAPPSNRDSIGTTDSNQEEEEPPPLPKKYAHRSMELDGDTNNNGEATQPLPPRHNYDTVFAPRGSFLYNSMVQRKNNNEKAPTPPPKKRNPLRN
ncbi:dedicator of cytokinesis protein myoblast city isoform X2 [Anticarsia gemmatalis]|uniref:dedicator of cytokinesis protein myoblast city isoform X2 n=1 Tax=Anticarsia gemmatalis TaxID=129554 RepID=UPI003F77755D